jgi:hypothetical protein
MSIGGTAPMYDMLVLSRDDIEQPPKRVGFAAASGTPAKKKVPNPTILYLSDLH